MLEEKLKKGLKMTGDYTGDDDSGLEIDTGALEIEETIDPDKLHINLNVSNPKILILQQSSIFFLQFSFWSQ